MANQTFTVRVGMTGNRQVTAGLKEIGAAGAAAGAQVEQGLARGGRAIDKTQISLSRTGESMGQVGGKIAKTGAVITGVVAASGLAAVNWQSQFAGVTKTVDFSNKAFGSAADQTKRLEGELRGMARTMPTTHKDIAAVAEAAGQLGVSTPSIASFTKTMVMLGDTTNLSADEAATSIAQLMNVMGTAPDKVSNLGSVIVDLGNKGASTERDIVQMGQRISGVGNQIGLSEDQVLAFGSAIASTGINVEAGGTAMSKTFLRIDGAVRQGGKGLDALAETSGMTAEQFQQAWGQDAARATDQFVEGLGALQASGGNVAAVLADIGIKGQYERDVMTRLAGATKAAGNEHGLLTSNLDNAAAAMKANTALTDEARKRYETDASKIKIAWNNIVDAGISAGGSLLPVIASMADEIAKVAQSFGDLDPGTQSFIVKAAAAAGVALLLGGGLLKAAGSALVFYSNLTTAVGGAVALRGAMTGLMGVLGPVGLALTAVAAGAAVLDHFGAQAKSVDQLSTAIKGVADGSQGLDSLFSQATWADKLESALSGGVGPANSLQEAIVGLDRTQGSWLGKVALLREKMTPGDQALQSAQKQVGALDQALSKMVSEGNAEQAGAAFSEATKGLAELGVTTEDLTRLFPQYTKALGDSTGKTSETIKKQADLSKAFSATRQSLIDMQGPVRLSLEQQDKMSQSLFTEGNVYQNAITGRLAYKQAISDTNAVIKDSADKIKKHGGALSENTQAGRDNKTALLNLASAGKGYVQSLVAQGASAKEARAATQTVRESFLKAADAAGIGSGKAKQMADDLGLIPKNVSVKITAFVDAIGEARKNAFIQTLKALPPEVQSKIFAIYDSKGPKAALKELEKVQKHKDVHGNLTYETNAAETADKAKRESNKAPNRSRQLKYTQNAADAAAKASKEAAKAKGAQRQIHYDHNAASASKAATKEANKAKNANKKILYDHNAASTARAASTAASKAKGANKSIHYDSNAATAARSAEQSAAKASNITRYITYIKKGGKAYGGKVDKEDLAFGIGGSPRLVGKINMGTITPRADDVDIRVSRDEWVVQKTSAQKYGDYRMAGVNAGVAKIVMPGDTGYDKMSFAYGGKPGFATGGTPDPAIVRFQTQIDNPLGDVAALVRSMNAAASALRTAQSKTVGPLRTLTAAQRKYTAAVNKRDAIKVRIADLSKAAARTKGVTLADRQLAAARRSLAKQNTVVTSTSKAKTKAQEAYNKVADVAKAKATALSDSQKALADRQQQVADAARSASDQFREAYRSGSTDAKDWIDLMNQGASEITGFTSKIATLRKAGLSETLVQQILKMGAVAGSEISTQITLGGAGLVAQLNKANTSLQKAADSLGYAQATGTGRYDSGGWLMPGQVGVNKSGKPEPVFTNDQWSTLASFVATPLGLGAGRSTPAATGAMIDYSVLAGAVRDAIAGLSLSGVVDASAIDSRIQVTFEKAARTYNRRV